MIYLIPAVLTLAAWAFYILHYKEVIEEKKLPHEIVPGILNLEIGDKIVCKSWAESVTTFEYTYKGITKEGMIIIQYLSGAPELWKPSKLAELSLDLTIDEDYMDFLGEYRKTKDEFK